MKAEATARSNKGAAPSAKTTGVWFSTSSHPAAETNGSTEQYSAFGSAHLYSENLRQVTGYHKS